MGIPASTGTISREEIQSVYANTLRKLFCGIALERAVVSAAAPAAVAAGTCRNGRTTANGSAVAAAVCVVLTCEICRAGERAAGIAGHTGFLAGHYHFRRAIGQGKCGKHVAAGICKGNGLSGRNRSLGQERIAAGCFEHITAAGCNDGAAGIGDRVIAVAAVQRAVSAAGLGNKDIAAVEGNVAVGVQPVAGCIDIGMPLLEFPPPGPPQPPCPQPPLLLLPLLSEPPAAL